ncbi:sensor histidine kinase [Elizabethkingia miricola]|uniref:sensor histidine kinase n=1 Tax=Elizabethkingia miricola TaxID=172045 RepID=UPI002ACD2447|nr:HAMP domain-containing sensor histidine kinase [Elizabethkingia miricola]WQM39443.1 HAMP domain-containing sensor histidine kinase [Elizabethkingia miricola]
MNNALPQNSVKDLVKDKYGFIWIATDNGIVKYDGQNFETYSKFNISDIHFDSFYGVTEKDSLVLFSSQEKQQIIIKNSRIRNTSQHLAIRSYIKNGEKYTLLNKTCISNIHNSNTHYYINTNNAHYIFFNGTKIIYRQGKEKKVLNIPYSSINTIFMDNDRLFIRDTKKQKVYMIHQGKLTLMTKPTPLLAPDTQLYWQQTTNQTFVIQNNKLYRVHYKDNRFRTEYLFTYNNENKSFIHSIYYDVESHKLFLGSLIQGLNIVTLSDFKQPRQKSPNWNNVANASLPFTDSSIIIPQGLEIGENGVIRSYPFNSSNHYVMLYDDEKNILTLSPTTLIKHYKKNNYTTSSIIISEKLKITGLFKSKGLYFMALVNIYNKNFLRLYENDQFQKISYSFAFKSHISSCVAINENNFLVGTSDGLYSVSTYNNNIRKISSELNIKNIIENKDKDYWITTVDKGFFLLKSFNLKPIPPDKDQFLLTPHYILEDHNENLWISSNNGLYKVAKKEVLSSIQTPSKRPFYYRYDTKNGLLNNEFNGGSMPNAYELNNKNFVFPSMNGFIIFNPDSVRTYYPRKNTMRIERIRINDGNINFFDTKIIQKNNIDHLEIFIDIPYYSNHENLHIDAKWGKGPWKKVKEQRKLDIYNLQPGNHKLTFRIFLGPKLGYDYRSINLKVIPSFYQTKWFYTVVILLTITIVILIILMTKHLKHKNKKLQESLQYEKELLTSEAEYHKKLMQIISHDITTPLKFIYHMSQQMTEISDAEMQKEYFDCIYKSSEQLYKFTRNLKNYAQLFKETESINNQPYFLYELVEEKKLLFQEIAFKKSNTIINHIKRDTQLNSNKNILKVILHNIIDNAVKYTNGGVIEIENLTAHESNEIIIKDTGKGIPKKKLIFYNKLAKKQSFSNESFEKQGLGLHLVIQLAGKADIQLTFENNIPNGTIVHIKLIN